MRKENHISNNTTDRFLLGLLKFSLQNAIVNFHYTGAGGGKIVVVGVEHDFHFLCSTTRYRKYELPCISMEIDRLFPRLIKKSVRKFQSRHREDPAPSHWVGAQFQDFLFTVYTRFMFMSVLWIVLSYFVSMWNHLGIKIMLFYVNDEVCNVIWFFYPYVIMLWEGFIMKIYMKITWKFLWFKLRFECIWVRSGGWKNPPLLPLLISR